MVQAHASELLNQKESENDSPMDHASSRPLYAATQRLMGALERLEQNLQRVTVDQSREIKQHEQIQLFERENKMLKTEHDKLNDAIARLEDEYSDLHQVASTIYNKLEDSIKRLTQIIEN